MQTKVDLAKVTREELQEELDRRNEEAAGEACWVELKIPLSRLLGMDSNVDLYDAVSEQLYDKLDSAKIQYLGDHDVEICDPILDNIPSFSSYYLAFDAHYPTGNIRNYRISKD